MNMAQLLKDSANAVQAATLVKRTSADLVRQVPYAVIGAAVLVGALAGFAYTHGSLRGRRRPS